MRTYIVVIVTLVMTLPAYAQYSGGTGEPNDPYQMQTASTFLESGWDFVDEAANGTEDIWWILDGQDYPRWAWEN